MPLLPRGIIQEKVLCAAAVQMDIVLFLDLTNVINAPTGGFLQLLFMQLLVYFSLFFFLLLNLL